MELIQNYRLRIAQDINQGNLELFLRSYDRYSVSYSCRPVQKRWQSSIKRKEAWNSSFPPPHSVWIAPMCCMTVRIEKGRTLDLWLNCSLLELFHKAGVSWGCWNSKQKFMYSKIHTWVPPLSELGRCADSCLGTASQDENRLLFLPWKAGKKSLRNWVSVTFPRVTQPVGSLARLEPTLQGITIFSWNSISRMLGHVFDTSTGSKTLSYTVRKNVLPSPQSQTVKVCHSLLLRGSFLQTTWKIQVNLRIAVVLLFEF